MLRSQGQNQGDKLGDSYDDPGESSVQGCCGGDGGRMWVDPIYRLKVMLAEFADWLSLSLREK